MAATAQNSGGRVNEMHQAVRALIDVYEDWIGDPRQPPTPTLAFETALRRAVVVVLDGDIPARCQDLWLQVSRMQEEWNQYARGQRDRLGRPLARFWSAFSAVQNSLRQSVAVTPKRPEPVKTLLDQKVSYEQIAFHIYGYRGKGVFVNASGQPDIALIHQEADKPGTVVPATWIHPIQEAMASDSVVQQSRQTEWVNSMGDGREIKPQIIDPASIEDLLLEGQFPDVIARVKAVPLQTVLAEAERLGIAPNERPNFGGGDLAEELPSTEIEEPQSAIPQASPVAATDPEAHTPKPIDAPGSGDETDSLIISLSGQNKGAAEIAAELGVTPQKVGAVLREHRKRLTEATA